MKDPGNVSIRAVLNGEIKQNSNTSDMIFPIPYLVSFISRVMTLYPSDLIATGTPEGIGPMKRGDEIRIVIGGLDELVNRVI
jgi:2-keto-4-pentenoate hydratase/2-oxohepta-3-ene-1,7-dioic acid hydratase in catechol pathway